MPPKGTVLIIEDNDAIQWILDSILTSSGYQVVLSCNGHEALVKLDSGLTPNLILLDMKMPVMDGWEFAARFRERYGSETPIVAMTAAGNASVRAESIQANACLSKPFDLEELRSTVKSLITPTMNSVPPSSEN